MNNPAPVRIVFIDDFRKKIWVYFLKNKSETFSRFKEFKALTEKQSRNIIKVIRSDGGGAYDSHEFTDFFK